MDRGLAQLKTEKFDVLIIGGGIHGATIVWECARKGYKACLIEKDDFGAQTSANSLKVLHGGLRYLQHANVKRMRESISSRKIFQQMAPHLVRSVPFVIPTSGHFIKSRLALAVALKLNDVISFDRNRNIAKQNYIPGGTTISKDSLQDITGLEDRNITGGAVWYESIALKTERLLFEFLYEAFDKGATLVNYAKAEKLEIENGRISKVKVTDGLTGESFFARADYVIDSVGPWLNGFLKDTKDYKKLYSPLTKAVNIIVRKNIFNKYAIGIESVKEFKDEFAVINKGKRLLFFVPIGEYTMIGTTYKIYNDDPGEIKVEKQDVVDILNEVNASHKSLNLKYKDVTAVHVGAQAMPDIEFGNEFDVQPETHSVVFDHSVKGNIDNLMTVKSVKYTTAPAIAKNVTDMLYAKIKHPPLIRDEVFSAADYHKNQDNFFKQNTRYDQVLLNRLWNTYGVRSQKVIEYIEIDDDSKASVLAAGALYFGELKYVLQQEMAISLEDVIHRRLGLTAFCEISEKDRNSIKAAMQKII